MTESELRALVRGVIAEQAAGRGARATGPVAPVPATFLHGQVSHAQFALPQIGGSCLIEPAVSCNHCGYCRTYGY